MVQNSRGWVADEHVADLAPMLGMTVHELDGVASFYPFIFRRPVGRHIIFVCDGLSCWVMGYEARHRGVDETAWGLLGGTTEDGRFTLLPVSCMGECDRAPALKWTATCMGTSPPETIETILERYEVRPVEKPLTGTMRGDGKPLTLKEYEETGGYEALRCAPLHDAERGPGGRYRRPA